MCSAWLRGARHRVSPHYFLRRPLCPTAFPSGTVAAWPRAVAQRLCSFMCATLASLCGVKRRWRARALFAFVRATSRKSAERRNKRSRSALFARYMTSRRRVCRAAGTAVALGCICAALGSALDTAAYRQTTFCRVSLVSKRPFRGPSHALFRVGTSTFVSSDALHTTPSLQLPSCDFIKSTLLRRFVLPSFCYLASFVLVDSTFVSTDATSSTNDVFIPLLHSSTDFTRRYSTLLDSTRLYRQRTTVSPLIPYRHSASPYSHSAPQPFGVTRCHFGTGTLNDFALENQKKKKKPNSICVRFTSNLDHIRV